MEPPPLLMIDANEAHPMLFSYLLFTLLKITNIVHVFMVELIELLVFKRRHRASFVMRNVKNAT